MTEQMNMNDYAKMFGVELPDTSAKKIGNTGRSFFERKVGDYSVIILNLVEKVKNADGEILDKGNPGQPFGLLKFAIVSDPDGKVLSVVNNDFVIPEEIPYGRCVYTQYITYDSDKQFQNKSILQGLYIKDIPQLAVVQNADSKSDYEIILPNLGFYLGAPAKMTLVQKQNKDGKLTRPFIPENGLELTDNTISKEKIAQRKKIAERIIEKLDAKLKAEEEERKRKKSESNSDAAGMKPEYDSSDEILNSYEGI